MRGGSRDLKEKVTEGKSIILNKDELERQYAYIYLKRFFDVILSLIGLLVLSLLFLIIAAFVKFCDGGPVLYTQERVGKDGRRFKIYKFRSMYVDADKLLEKLKEKNEVTGPMFKMKNDPRITSALCPVKYTDQIDKNFRRLDCGIVPRSSRFCLCKRVWY